MTWALTDLGSVEGATGATLVLSSISIPSGSLIIVGVDESDSSQQFPGFFQDSAGDELAMITSAQNNNAVANGVAGVYFFSNNPSTVTSITYNRNTTAATTAFSAMYATGQDANQPLDDVVTVRATGTGTALSSGASGTPQFASSLLIGFGTQKGSAAVTWTQDATWTTTGGLAQNTTAAASSIIGGNQTASAAKTYAPTSNRSSPWAAFVVGFVPAGSTITTGIVRAPFIVPKAEEPPRALGALATYQTLFGKVPGPKFNDWRSRTQYVPEPFWEGCPENSAVISLLTQQRIHGGGGQVQEKFWSRYQNWDSGASFWPGNPDPSAIIGLLTQQRMFGAGGQVPTKLWRWDYDVEYPNKWQGTPTDNTALIQLVKPFYKLWRYDYEPDKYWQGTPTDNPPLWQLAEPFNNEWNIQYTYEPDKYWQGKPTSNPIPWQLAEPFSKLWRYDYNVDWVGWQGAPTYNQIPEELAEPFNNEWNIQYTYEPDKFWQGRPISNPVPQQLAEPFSKLWRYDYNVDWVGWQGSPTFNQVPEELAPAFSKQWRWDHVPEPFWLGTPLNADSLYTPQAEPFSKQWRYDYDSGETKWTWAPPGSNTLNELVGGGKPFFKLWRYDLITDTWWQGEPQANPSLLQLPPFARLWRYDLEPDKYWQGAPTQNLTPQQLAQPFHKLWRYDYEPDKYWQGNPVPSNIEFFPIVVPFGKLWRYDLDTSTWWQGNPIGSYFQALPETPSSTMWRWPPNLDTDARWWNWPPQAALTLSMLVEGGSPTFKLWRYDLITDTWWQGEPTTNEVLIPGIPTGPPFLPPQWEYLKEFEVPFPQGPSGTPLALLFSQQQVMMGQAIVFV